MKLTKIQKTTISMFALYLIWEFAVQIWARSETTAVIRADLIFIYPVLFILLILSLSQKFFHKR